MKRFKYKFTKFMTAAMILGLVLCITGFAINLAMCITNDFSSAADPVYPILQYSLMFFVTVVLFVLLLSIMIHSYYVIDDKTFKTQFGLITSKYKLEDITTVVWNKQVNKLSVTMTNDTFIVIVVKQDWYDRFIDALLAANPKIEYSIISAENKPDNKSEDDKK